MNAPAAVAAGDIAAGRDRVAWAPLLTLALVVAMGFTAMQSFGTVQEAAKAELGLSDHALGVVQGVAAAVPMAVFSVPIGLLVDRVNRVRLLVALSLLWTAGTLLTAYATNLPTLFTARMLAGIGTTGGLTAVLSIAADLCRPEQRGRALLVPSLGKMTGVAAAVAVTGALFGALGGGALAGLPAWRAAHLVLGVVALALVVPLLFLREPARREIAVVAAPPLRVAARELWQRRAFLIPLFAGQVAVVMADASAGIWAAPVLQRSFALTPDRFAGWMGALLLGTGVLGAVLGGWAADRGQRSGRRGGILLGGLVAAAVGVPAAFFPVMPGVTGFAVAFGALMLCGTVLGLIVSVALTVLLPNEVRGLAIGVFISIAGIVGFGIAPSLVTLVSALLGGEARLAPALAIVGVATSLASVGAFAIAIRNAPIGQD